MYNELIINQIGGLYNQLYNLEEYSYQNYENNGFINVNAIFWSELFEISNVKNMIDRLCHLDSIYSTKLQAIKSNPSAFMRSFINAINNIKFQNLDSKTCFQYLETLQMVCHMHTYLYSYPFELTIYEGYKHDQFSSEQLKKKSILKYTNPYYSFINDKIISKIHYDDIKILWIKGRLNISGFCLARMIREKHPNVFIVSIDSNSEFFSFSKIIPTLKHNHALFSVFDCIVLNDSQKTYNELKKHILENLDLSKVDNIIYSPDKGKSIICTNSSIIFPEDITVSQEEISMNKVINLKLFPNNKCYWNKCSFCAINKKYLNNNNCWDLDYSINQLKTLYKHGINKFWSIDEAIPAKTLEKLCDVLVKEKLRFSWHVRTRIEKEILSNGLPEKLSVCGLKHILFGFESASYRVLTLMNKTNDLKTYTELAEKIVKTFNDLKIYVHFPIIIGFPTESQRERNETFKFIDYLCNKYPYFSYNINVLSLDTSSHLYSCWEKYDIASIEYPCAPHDFIGNSVMWKSRTNSIDIKSLEFQAEKQMRKQFIWYPKSTLLDINSFYSMWEYSRSQLNIEKKHNNIVLKQSLKMNQKLSLDRNSTLFKDDEGLYCLYNLVNHQCVRGGQIIWDVITEIQLNFSVERFFKESENPQLNPIYNFVIDLIQHGFIQYID